MIVAISGKIGRGKDTVGSIIQYLTSTETGTFQASQQAQKKYGNLYPHYSNWRIHKFADALKDIVCILTGCTREQLEDSAFKDSKLGDEWIRYDYADGFIKKYIGDGEMGTPIMNNKQCDKERYEIELKTNWQTAYKQHLTYRELLQYLGTDLLRNQLHENIWINALFSKYKLIPDSSIKIGYLNRSDDLVKTKEELLDIMKPSFHNYPNWIITDCRFPNEAKAVKDRGGIVIRVNRPKFIIGKVYDGRVYSGIRNDNDGKGNYHFFTDTIPTTMKQYFTEHPSEISLDNYNFDYIINNNGTIEELITTIKEILIKEKII